MAVVTLKAGAATARDATPQEPIDPKLTRGPICEAIGTLESVNGNSIGSVYILCHGIPSNARIVEVILDSDNIGTTTAADIGLYDQEGTVVDADFFASAVNLAGGAVSNSRVTHESGVFEIADVEKELWDALGLAADPGLLYDVCLTLTAASDGAATITLRTRYTLSM